jgi:hypothetical protein
MLNDTSKSMSAETREPNLALTKPKLTKLRPRKLTVQFIEALPTRVADTEVKGLRVEVGRTGTKRFRFKTDVRKGERGAGAGKAQTVNMTLGVYPAMPLEQAGAKAAETRASCRDKRDPRRGTARDRTVPTVANLFELYIADWYAVKVRSPEYVYTWA